MAGPTTKTLTRILVLLVSILGMAAPSRHAVADSEWWYMDAILTDVSGITLWQPRLRGYLKWNEDEPDGFDGDIGRIKQGIAKRCQKVLDLLTDEKALRAFAAGADDRQRGLYSCIVMIVLTQAKPAPMNTFDTSDLPSDIENRLNLKTFRSTYGNGFDGGPEPFFFRDAKKDYGDKGEDIITKDHANLNVLSRWEGRNMWMREVNLLAAADWTGDGHADLLVLYYDRSLNGGTYSILFPLILTTGSRSDLISAIEPDYWAVDHREQLLEALGHLRE